MARCRLRCEVSSRGSKSSRRKRLARTGRSFWSGPRGDDLRDLHSPELLLRGDFPSWWVPAAFQSAYSVTLSTRERALPSDSAASLCFRALGCPLEPEHHSGGAAPERLSMRCWAFAAGTVSPELARGGALDEPKRTQAR